MFKNISAIAIILSLFGCSGAGVDDATDPIADPSSDPVDTTDPATDPAEPISCAGDISDSNNWIKNKLFLKDYGDNTTYYNDFAKYPSTMTVPIDYYTYEVDPYKWILNLKITNSDNFNTKIPDISTIAGWYSSLDDNGYTKNNNILPAFILSINQEDFNPNTGSDFNFCINKDMRIVDKSNCESATDDFTYKNCYYTSKFFNIPKSI